MPSTDWLSELLTYWTSPLDGATGDDAVSDSHGEQGRAEAVALIKCGGPWDEEILGPRPPDCPLSWPPISETKHTPGPMIASTTCRDCGDPIGTDEEQAAFPVEHYDDGDVWVCPTCSAMYLDEATGD